MKTQPSTVIVVLALFVILGFAATVVAQDSPAAVTNGFYIYVPGVVKAPANYALLFDGIDDFAPIADKGDFDFDQTFTVEAWVKPLSVTWEEFGWRGVVTGQRRQLPWLVSGWGGIEQEGFAGARRWIFRVCRENNGCV